MLFSTAAPVSNRHGFKAGAQENLKARLIEAKKRDWLGEIEGLNISQAGTEQKLMGMASVQESSRDGDIRFSHLSESPTA